MLVGQSVDEWVSALRWIALNWNEKTQGGRGRKMAEKRRGEERREMSVLRIHAYMVGREVGR